MNKISEKREIQVIEDISILDNENITDFKLLSSIRESMRDMVNRQKELEEDFNLLKSDFTQIRSEFNQLSAHVLSRGAVINILTHRNKININRIIKQKLNLLYQNNNNYFKKIDIPKLATNIAKKFYANIKNFADPSADEISICGKDLTLDEMFSFLQSANELDFESACMIHLQKLMEKELSLIVRERRR